MAMCLTAADLIEDDDDEIPFAEDETPWAESVAEPMPTNGDMLVARAADSPDDAGPRLILADWLAEHCEDELERVMRDGVVGVRNLRRLKILVDRLKRPASVKMLWASVVILDVEGMFVPGMSYFGSHGPAWMSGSALPPTMTISSSYRTGFAYTASPVSTGIVRTGNP
jgi:uncharacterized protein (TIGR02996 family)